MWTLTTVGSVGPTRGQTLWYLDSTTGKQLLLGRKDCDIEIHADRSVSRKHAEIRVGSLTPEQVGDPSAIVSICIKDLSKFGTFVKRNGVIVSQQGSVTELQNGDTITFGISNTEYSVLYEPMVLCVAGLIKEEKEKAVDTALSQGFHVISEWQPRVTHMFARPTMELTHEMLCALATGTPLLSTAWLEALRARSTFAPPPSVDDFLPPLRLPSILGSGIVHLGKTDARRMLFKNLIFLCADDALFKSDLASFIKLGGGSMDTVANRRRSSIETPASLRRLVFLDQGGAADAALPSSSWDFVRTLRWADHRSIVAAVVSGRIEDIEVPPRQHPVTPQDVGDGCKKKTTPASLPTTTTTTANNNTHSVALTATAGASSLVSGQSAEVSDERAPDRRTSVVSGAGALESSAKSRRTAPWAVTPPRMDMDPASGISKGVEGPGGDQGSGAGRGGNAGARGAELASDRSPVEGGMEEGADAGRDHRGSRGGGVGKAVGAEGEDAGTHESPVTGQAAAPKPSSSLKRPREGEAAQVGHLSAGSADASPHSGGDAVAAVSPHSAGSHEDSEDARRQAKKQLLPYGSRNNGLPADPLDRSRLAMKGVEEGWAKVSHELNDGQVATADGSGRHKLPLARSASPQGGAGSTRGGELADEVEVEGGVTVVYEQLVARDMSEGSGGSGAGGGGVIPADDGNPEVGCNFKAFSKVQPVAGPGNDFSIMIPFEDDTYKDRTLEDEYAATRRREMQMAAEEEEAEDMFQAAGQDQVGWGVANTGLKCQVHI
eukprot:jgi/Mesvir1/29103/Mv18409-RA.1